MKKLVMYLLDNTYFCIGLISVIFAGWVTYLIKQYSERLQDARDDRQHYYDSWHDLSERNEKLIGYIQELETENFNLRALLEEHRGVQTEYQAALQAQMDYNNSLKDIIKYLNHDEDFPCPPDPLQEPETKQ